MSGKMVIGRIVSLDNGRPVIEVPPGSPRANAARFERLLKAARAYKARKTAETLAALTEAADAID